MSETEIKKQNPFAKASTTTTTSNNNNNNASNHSNLEELRKSNFYAALVKAVGGSMTLQDSNNNNNNNNNNTAIISIAQSLPVPAAASSASNANANASNLNNINNNNNNSIEDIIFEALRNSLPFHIDVSDNYHNNNNNSAANSTVNNSVNTSNFNSRRESAVSKAITTTTTTTSTKNNITTNNNSNTVNTASNANNSSNNNNLNSNNSVTPVALCLKRNEIIRPSAAPSPSNRSTTSNIHNYSSSATPTEANHNRSSSSGYRPPRLIIKQRPGASRVVHLLDVLTHEELRLSEVEMINILRTLELFLSDAIDYFYNSQQQQQHSSSNANSNTNRHRKHRHHHNHHNSNNNNNTNILNDADEETEDSPDFQQQQRLGSASSVSGSDNDSEDDEDSGSPIHTDTNTSITNTNRYNHHKLDTNVVIIHSTSNDRRTPSVPATRNSQNKVRTSSNNTNPNLNNSSTFNKNSSNNGSRHRFFYDDDDEDDEDEGIQYNNAISTSNASNNFNTSGNNNNSKKVYSSHGPNVFSPKSEVTLLSSTSNSQAMKQTATSGVQLIQDSASSAFLYLPSSVWQQFPEVIRCVGKFLNTNFFTFQPMFLKCSSNNSTRNNNNNSIHTNNNNNNTEEKSSSPDNNATNTATLFNNNNNNSFSSPNVRLFTSFLEKECLNSPSVYECLANICDSSLAMGIASNHTNSHDNNNKDRSDDHQLPVGALPPITLSSGVKALQTIVFEFIEKRLTHSLLMVQQCQTMMADSGMLPDALFADMNFQAAGGMHGNFNSNNNTTGAATNNNTELIKSTMSTPWWLYFLATSGLISFSLGVQSSNYHHGTNKTGSSSSKSKVPHLPILDLLLSTTETATKLFIENKRSVYDSLVIRSATGASLEAEEFMNLQSASQPRQVTGVGPSSREMQPTVHQDNDGDDDDHVRKDEREKTMVNSASHTNAGVIVTNTDSLVVEERPAGATTTAATNTHNRNHRATSVVFIPNNNNINSSNTKTPTEGRSTTTHHSYDGLNIQTNFTYTSNANNNNNNNVNTSLNSPQECLSANITPIMVPAMPLINEKSNTNYLSLFSLSDLEEEEDYYDQGGYNGNANNNNNNFNAIYNTTNVSLPAAAFLNANPNNNNSRSAGNNFGATNNGTGRAFLPSFSVDHMSNQALLSFMDGVRERAAFWENVNNNNNNNTNNVNTAFSSSSTLFYNNSMPSNQNNVNHNISNASGTWSVPAITGTYSSSNKRDSASMVLSTPSRSVGGGFELNSSTFMNANNANNNNNNNPNINCSSNMNSSSTLARSPVTAVGSKMMVGSSPSHHASSQNNVYNSNNANNPMSTSYSYNNLNLNFHSSKYHYNSGSSNSNAANSKTDQQYHHQHNSNRTIGLSNLGQLEKEISMARPALQFASKLGNLYATLDIDALMPLVPPAEEDTTTATYNYQSESADTQAVDASAASNPMRNSQEFGGGSIGRARRLPSNGSDGHLPSRRSVSGNSLGGGSNQNSTAPSQALLNANATNTTQSTSTRPASPLDQSIVGRLQRQLDKNLDAYVQNAAYASSNGATNCHSPSSTNYYTPNSNHNFLASSSKTLAAVLEDDQGAEGLLTLSMIILLHIEEVSKALFQADWPNIGQECAYFVPIPCASVSSTTKTTNSTSATTSASVMAVGGKDRSQPAAVSTTTTITTTTTTTTTTTMADSLANALVTAALVSARQHHGKTAEWILRVLPFLTGWSNEINKKASTVQIATTETEDNKDDGNVTTSVITLRGKEKMSMQADCRRELFLSTPKYDSFPMAWLPGFVQVSDTAKHLLRSGHYAPKALESVTWYMASMASYYCSLRREALGIFIAQKEGFNGMENPLNDLANVSYAREARRVQLLLKRQQQHQENVETPGAANAAGLEDITNESAGAFGRTRAPGETIDGDNGDDANADKQKQKKTHGTSSKYERKPSTSSYIKREKNKFKIKRNFEDFIMNEGLGPAEMLLQPMLALMDALGEHFFANDPTTIMENLFENHNSQLNSEDNSPSQDNLNNPDTMDEENEYSNDSPEAMDPLYHTNSFHKEHTLCLELCVHYFLEIMDVLLEMSQWVSHKTLPFCALTAGLTDHHKRHTMGFEGFPLAEKRSSSVASPPLPPLRTSRPYTKPEETEMESERPLGVFQLFMSAYCHMLMNKCVSLFSHDGVGDLNSTSCIFPESERTMPMILSEDKLSPWGVLSFTPYKILHTMWWPNEPFRLRRHLCRVLQHAQLVSMLYIDRSAKVMAGCLDNHERVCEARTLKYNQIFSERLYTPFITPMLDTSNGVAAVLLSLGCEKPKLIQPLPHGADGAHQLASTGQNPRLLISPLSLSGTWHTRQSKRRPYLRALYMRNFGFWMRIHTLRTIAQAGCPTDVSLRNRFKTSMKHYAAGLPDRAAQQHYSVLASFFSVQFSVMSANLAKTYVRLIFLRLVQAFNSDKSPSSIPQIFLAATQQSHGNNANSSTNAGGRGVDMFTVLNGESQLLWLEYLYELIRTLRLLCWNHRRAHETAANLSIPSVLARFFDKLYMNPSQNAAGSVPNANASWSNANVYNNNSLSYNHSESFSTRNYGGNGNNNSYNRSLSFVSGECVGGLSDEEDEDAFLSPIEGYNLNEKVHDEYDPPSAPPAGFVDFEDGSSDHDDEDAFDDTVETLKPTQVTFPNEPEKTEHVKRSDSIPNPLLSTLPPQHPTSNSASISSPASPVHAVHMPVPKLALGTLGPPLYFASSGDTSAAQEAALFTKPTVDPAPMTQSLTTYSSPCASPKFSTDMDSQPTSPLPSNSLTQPIVIPRLALGSVAPPLYYTSTGDTGAAQEVQGSQSPVGALLSPGVSSCSTSALSPNMVALTLSNADITSATNNNNNNGNMNNNNNATNRTNEINENNDASMQTISPFGSSRTFGNGNHSYSNSNITSVTATSATTTTVPGMNSVALTIPKLALGTLGPPLYYTSTGDTGAMDENMPSPNPNPHLPMPPHASAVGEQSSDSSPFFGSPASPYSMDEVAETEAPSSTLSQGMAKNKYADPNSAMSPNSNGDKQDSKKSSTTAHHTTTKRIVETNANKKIRIYTPRVVQPIRSIHVNPAVSAKEAAAQERRRRSEEAHSIPPLYGYTNTNIAGEQLSPSRSGINNNNLLNSNNPNSILNNPFAAIVHTFQKAIASELVLCVISLLLERRSGGIQYVFTVSSLTERRMFHNKLQPRLLYSFRQQRDPLGNFIYENKKSGNHKSGGGSNNEVNNPFRQGANNNSSSRHGPTAYHVLKSLQDFLQSSANAGVRGLLKEWFYKEFEEKLVAVHAKQFDTNDDLSNEVSIASEDLFKRTSDFTLMCAMETVMPVYSIGCYALLRLLFPRRNFMNHFQIGRRIGSGGYGSVLSANYCSRSRGAKMFSLLRLEDELLLRWRDEIAIKTIPLHLQGSESGALPLVHSEVLALLRMRHHPRIMTLITFGNTGSDYFIVSPLYHGGSFSDWRLRNYPPGCAALIRQTRSRSSSAVGASAGVSCLSRPLSSQRRRRLSVNTEEDKEEHEDAVVVDVKLHEELDGREEEEGSQTLLSTVGRLFLQVLEAISATHYMDIRHGDVKAANLFIEEMTPFTGDEALDPIYSPIRNRNMNRTASSSDTTMASAGRGPRGSTGANASQAHHSNKRFVPTSIRLGDFGSCDFCGVDDLYALYREVEAGEAKFVSGRWGTGRGTEAIQPPEVMFPKHRFNILRSIIEKEFESHMNLNNMHTTNTSMNNFNTGNSSSFAATTMNNNPNATVNTNINNNNNTTSPMNNSNSNSSHMNPSAGACTGLFGSTHNNNHHLRRSSKSVGSAGPANTNNATTTGNLYNATMNNNTSNATTTTTCSGQSPSALPGATPGVGFTGIGSSGGAGNSNENNNIFGSQHSHEDSCSVDNGFQWVKDKLRQVELSVDIWACGCLLYEMLTGRMLFGEARLGRLVSIAAYYNHHYNSNQGANTDEHANHPSNASNTNMNETVTTATGSGGVGGAGNDDDNESFLSNTQNPRHLKQHTRATNNGSLPASSAASPFSDGLPTSPSNSNSNASPPGPLRDTLGGTSTITSTSVMGTTTITTALDEWEKQDLEKAVGPRVVRFLSSLLSLDPLSRPTAIEALYAWNELLLSEIDMEA